MGFNRLTKNVLNISRLPDRVQNQASALKLLFDQAGADIKEAVNALMVEMEDSTASTKLGANIDSVTTKTVQAVLTAFESAIADRYTKMESDTLIATITNDLVADIDVNLTTGIITVTKKDGTKETFDTALEKVPAKFEIVENAGNYALKITNIDGTSTQTDITHLMNIYNFNNSDTINFEVTGEGNEKAVVANIKANSIGLDKLSLTVVSTLEGYMNSAKDSSSAARTSELNAASHANTASNKVVEATTAANTATAKATEASKSAADAKKWAEQVATANGIYVLPAVGEGQIIETLYGDYKLETVQLNQKTKLASTPVSENIRVEGIVSSTSVRCDASLERTSFYLTLNGETKQIRFGIGEGIFDAASSTVHTDIQNAFQQKFDEAFGVGNVTAEVIPSGARYKIKISSSGVVVVTSGDSDMLSILKITSGATNLLDTNITIAEFLDTEEATETFTINDYTNAISTSATLEEFFNAINGANIGVSIAYSIPEDAIIIQGTFEMNFSAEINLSATLGIFEALGFNEGAISTTQDACLVNITEPNGIVTENVELAANTFNSDGVLALLTILQQATYTKKEIDTKLNSIPNVQASTTDLEAGVSELATGDIHIVYE